jgi:hypothetical protein
MTASVIHVNVSLLSLLCPVVRVVGEQGGSDASPFLSKDVVGRASVPLADPSALSQLQQCQRAYGVHDVDLYPELVQILPHNGRKHLYSLTRAHQ